MAPGNVETEFKLVLPDAPAFEAVRAALVQRGGQVEAPVLQTNHFFDSGTRDLRDAGLALRLREAGGRFRLTLKGKGKSLAASGVVTSRPEEEIEVPEAEARAVLAGELDPLERLAAGAPPEAATLLGHAREALAGRPLTHLGSFRNERTKVRDVHFDGAATGQLVEMDRTHFPGDRTDLELELEVPAEVAAAVEGDLRGLFESLGLPVASAPSKAARFFDLSGV